MTETKHDPYAEERTLADWYQAHKDDPDFLERFEVVPPPKRTRGRPSRSMGARISVRFTPEEMEGIRSGSAASGLTYSEFVRRAVKAYCLETRE